MVVRFASENGGYLTPQRIRLDVAVGEGGGLGEPGKYRLLVVR